MREQWQTRDAAGRGARCLAAARSRFTVSLWPASSSRRFVPSGERFVLSGDGPAVPSHEVEHAARLAIEVLVLWGGDVLSLAFFAAPAVVFVGEGSGCGVALPAELLGAERRCVAVSTRGDVCAVLPEGARGWLTSPDGSTRPFDDPTAPPQSEPSAATERLLPLPLGARAHLCFANLEVQVATVRLGRSSRRALGIDAAMLASLGLSALTLASLLAALSRLTPAAGLNHDERADSTRLRVLRTYLTASVEREAPRRDGPSAAAPAARTKPPRPPPSHDPTASHAPADTDAEAALDPTLALDGMPQPVPDPIERRAQIQEARRFGIIGSLDWPELHDPRLKFERHMTGEEIALMKQLFTPESAPFSDGPGGLELSGTGLGGGGQASVVALGAVRTADAGQGGGLERFPAGNTLRDTHTARAPLARQLESIDSDPLAAASIRRAVHAERVALRGCYTEAGAPGTSPLALGAMVRFVVRGNGQIEQVRAADPALPANVSRCIERVFLGLSVPNPVSRPVHVTYRVALDS
jgi:hypothetical protein